MHQHSDHVRLIGESLTKLVFLGVAVALLFILISAAAPTVEDAPARDNIVIRSH